LCFWIPNTTNNEKVLNRDQTEEWKGWMQIIFILYHYFNAKETYNLVRILIAGYVWLTGFGNYSFFAVRGDFSYRRVFKMLFRLNFLVTVLCVTLNKEYMLYYICAMHTWWFLVVYAVMAPFREYNKSHFVIALKMLFLFLFSTLVFEWTPLFNLMFKPFGFLLKYENSFHEWKFRVSLDRYATLWGMMFAHFHPYYDTWWQSIDTMTPVRKYITKSTVVGVVLALGYYWFKTFLLLPDKYEYNAIHPYTSIIPITAYLVLRNLTPDIRSRYSWTLAFMGKVSLESYLAQFHVWLGDSAKSVLLLVPEYPLLNFLVASTLFLIIAHLLFDITQILNDIIFPNDVPDRVFLRNAGILVGIFVFIWWSDAIQKEIMS